MYEGIRNVAQQMPKYPILASEMKRRGLSSADVAKVLHIAPVRATAFMAGQLEPCIRANRALELCLAFEISMEALFFQTDRAMASDATVEAIARLLRLYADNGLNERTMETALEGLDKLEYLDAIHFVRAFVGLAELGMLTGVVGD